MLAVLMLALGVGTTLLGPAPRASAAVVPGSQADLQVTVSGPTTAKTGDTFSYSVVMSNNSLADADGATFSDELSFFRIAQAATCSATGGAECPATLTIGQNGVSGTIGALPHLGTVTVVVTGTFRQVGTVTNTATIDPPLGVTDPDTTTNTSVINTSVSAVADIGVTVSTDATSLTYGSSARYTAVVTNAGPQPADYSFVDANSFSSVSDGVVDVVTSDPACSTTGGAVCPDSGSLPGSVQIATLPAGSTVTFTWITTLVRRSACNSVDAPMLFTTARVDPNRITDPNSRNDTSTVRIPLVVDACRNADLAVTKTADAASLVPGGSVGYTLTFTNNGPDDATNVPIRDSAELEDSSDPMFGSHDYSGLTCRTTGGASCPDVPSAGSSRVIGGDTFSSVIPSLPAGSSVVIQYTDTFAVGSASCSPVRRQLLNNYAFIGVPVDVSDRVTSNNSVGTRTPVVEPLCTPADIAVTTATSAAVVTFPGTAAYTVTVTNNGPAAADGTQVTNSLRLPNASSPSQASSFSGRYDYSDLQCTAQGGAVCPDIPSSATGKAFGGTTFDATIPTLPAGSSLTVTFTASLGSLTATNGDTSGSLQNSVRVAAPAGRIDPNPQDNTAQASSSFSFAQIAVNNMVSTTAARTGDTVVYTVQVSNAGDGTADNVLFVDQIAPVMRFVSAQCRPSAGSPTCGAVSFDAASRTVRSTIASLARSESLTFTIVVTAGPTTSTATNVATATPSASSTYFDLNPDANLSRVNVQIVDTQSPVVITKQIDGLGATGLATAQTFSGTITCELQPAQNWSVTVPAGGSTASAPSILIYDGDTCAVSEDAPPTPPAGFTWSPTVTISPASFTPQASTRVDVTVTNALVAQPIATAQVTVTKRIEGLTAAGLLDPLTFSGTVTCTAADARSSSAAWTVTVAAGQTAATTAPITMPVDTRCVSSEDTPPSAPMGFTWATTNADPTTTGPLVAGSTSDVPVVNRVAVDTPPTPATGSLTIAVAIDGGPSGAAGTFSYAAFCGQDTFLTTVRVDAGTTASTTLTSIAAGTSCTVRQTARTAAPDGYEWGAPVIAQPTVQIVAGSTADVEVTNPLVRVSDPTNGGPTPAPGTSPSPSPSPLATPTPEQTPSGGGATTSGTSGVAPAATPGQRPADARTTLAYTGGEVDFPFLPLGIALIAAGVVALLLIRRRRHASGDRT